jgi:hypothetical protein
MTDEANAPDMNRHGIYNHEPVIQRDKQAW